MIGKIIKYVFKITFCAILITTLFAVGSYAAYADNRSVIDTANALNKKTVNQVRELNEHELSAIKGHPKIIVYTVKSTNNIAGDSKDEFDRLDKSKYQNNILIYLSKGNRQVHVQTGYGLRHALPNRWCNNFGVSLSVQQDLRNNEFNKAVRDLSLTLVSYLSDNSDKVLMPSHINDEKEKAVEPGAFRTVFIIFLPFLIAAALAVLMVLFR